MTHAELERIGLLPVPGCLFSWDGRHIRETEPESHHGPGSVANRDHWGQWWAYVRDTDGGVRYRRLDPDQGQALDALVAKEAT